MAEQCVALCDYIGLDDELSFRAGDLLTVLHKSSDGFWNCTLDPSHRGLVPSCMVTSNCTPQLQVANKAVALFDYTPKDTKEMAFKQFDVITVTEAHKSPGWWFGLNDSQGGDAKQTPKLFPANFVTFNLVVTAFNFTARRDFELTITKGDVVRVIRRWNDGWWEGYVGPRKGLFPSNYTVPNVSSFKAPKLFCNHCKDSVLPPALECPNCARNEEIVSTMSRTFHDWRGRGDPSLPLALFQHIEIDAVRGRAALLRFEDIRDGQTVRSGITPMKTYPS